MKAGIPDFRDVPIADWTIEQFARYYEYQYEKLYGFKTSKPRGQIKCIINLRTIKALHKYYGRDNISESELFKQYLDDMMIKNTAKTFRLVLLNNQENMTQYLDNRLAEQYGSLDDFKKQEEKKKQETEEYYKKLGWKPDINL